MFVVRVPGTLNPSAIVFFVFFFNRVVLIKAFILF